MPSRQEWEDYSANISPGRDGSGRELQTVRTILHVGDAQRALEDGKLSARLVYDESLLNTSRLPVVWTSANVWANGSIYGSVEFSFDWEPLVTGKRFYWVEVIRKYTPPAYRLLVAKEGTSLPNSLLKPYDPTSDDGPIKHIAGKWYWNANLTSEVMFAEDLPLERLAGLSFVQHHATMCRYGGSRCQESNLPSVFAAARVVAHVLARGIHAVDKHLSPAATHSAGRNFILDHALSGLWLRLVDKSSGSEAITSPVNAAEAMHGAVALYAMGKDEAANKLAGNVRKKLRGEALSSMISEHFDVPGWTYS